MYKRGQDSRVTRMHGPVYHRRQNNNEHIRPARCFAQVENTSNRPIGATSDCVSQHNHGFRERITGTVAVRWNAHC